MTLVGLLLLIVIGAVCGLLAELIVGFRVGGFLASTVVGFLGALIGSWLAARVGLPSGLPVTVDGYTIHILWAILGAVLLLAVLSLVRRAGYRRRTYVR